MSYPFDRGLGYPQSAKIQNLEDLAEEIMRARTKFPRGNDLTLALLEEVEELLTELDRTEGKTDARVLAEALQVACVAIRLAEEGDPTWKDGPETIAAVEASREVGLLARRILTQKYPKSGGDERPVEDLHCVQTLDDDMPCGVAQSDHQGMHHDFRAPSATVVAFSKSMPYGNPYPEVTP